MNILSEVQATDTFQATFNEEHVLEELRHFLPSQTPLKDFIHHNSLHAFQDMKFYEGIFKASKMFGYQVTLQLSDYRALYQQARIRRDILFRILKERKGEDSVVWLDKLLYGQYDEHKYPRIGQLRVRWKADYQIDLDTLVQPKLFRILCSYLDQGIAIWNFPEDDLEFLPNLRELERNSYDSFFRTRRAHEIFMKGEKSLSELLKMVVGDEAYFEQYLFDQQFSHRGWSGIVTSVETHPHSLLSRRNITLYDLIYFELLLEIDALDDALGENWAPLCAKPVEPPIDVTANLPYSELNEVFTLWQDAFEWSYYDEVLTALRLRHEQPLTETRQKNFQAIFCIDERECSLRRYIELVDPDCETLGAPGFFGVEFYFQPENAKFYDKLCPAPVTPKYLIKEVPVSGKREKELLYTSKSHTLIIGSLISITLGFWAAIKLVLAIFRPKMSPAISNAFIHMNKAARLTIENTDPNDRENGLQVGFSIEEMTNRVEAQLRGIGLTKNFAPLIYVIGHGSSSANNPHHGAHDCGACSGRPGSVNARVFAHMANHTDVRQRLRERGIDIPPSVQFVGGLHDTASDLIDFFDEDVLSPANLKAHAQNRDAFERALDYNAKERSRRFASIDTHKHISKVRKEIQKRSVSLFEPRPELGHGTNTLCIIGRRSLTRGIFLDRRAFLNSYDYTTDLAGDLLKGILRPIGPVAGGINLEYYFSRVDNYKLGAGTKLPHNVMGLIGVANSSDGDLRPGLPLQMIEVHDPVRLLVIVEHYPDVVLRTIQSEAAMYEWYANEWVHLVALDPDTFTYYYFKAGEMVPYHTLTPDIPRVSAIDELIESAMEMETNHIVDATKENLPIHLID